MEINLPLTPLSGDQGICGMSEENEEVLDSVNKSETLRQFVAELREKDLEKLVTTIEQDRLRGGNSLPHAALLNAVRPTLQDCPDLPRVPSPQRQGVVPGRDRLPGKPQPSSLGR